MSTPASGLTEPACPLIATDSSLKPPLLAAVGSAAPLAPAAPDCVSVSLPIAFSRFRLCVPFAASWRTACAICVCWFCSCCCAAAAREASSSSKFTIWSRLDAFSTASCAPGAKAANSVRIT